MTLYFGSDEIAQLWFGNDEVETAWIGNDEVFSSAPPAPMLARTIATRTNRVTVSRNIRNDDWYILRRSATEYEVGLGDDSIRSQFTLGTQYGVDIDGTVYDMGPLASALGSPGVNNRFTFTATVSPPDITSGGFLTSGSTLKIGPLVVPVQPLVKRSTRITNFLGFPNTDGWYVNQPTSGHASVAVGGNVTDVINTGTNYVVIVDGTRYEVGKPTTVAYESGRAFTDIRFSTGTGVPALLTAVGAAVGGFSVRGAVLEIVQA